MDRIGRALLLHQLITNPLPWHIDHDWSWEIIADNKATIAKCQSSQEAKAIIKAAKALKKELGETEKMVMYGRMEASPATKKTRSEIKRELCPKCIRRTYMWSKRHKTWHCYWCLHEDTKLKRPRMTKRR